MVGKTGLSEVSTFLRLAKRHKSSPQVLFPVAEFLDSLFGYITVYLRVYYILFGELLIFINQRSYIFDIFDLHILQWHVNIRNTCRPEKYLRP